MTDTSLSAVSGEVREATVARVELKTASSYTLGDVAATVDVLPLRSVAVFDEDGGRANIGGTLTTDGQLEGGTEVAYSGVDTAAKTLLLDDGLADIVFDRTTVFVLPVAQWKIAHVVLAEDVDGDAGTQRAIIPGHWWGDSRLAEGATPGQSVRVRTNGNGGWVIDDVDDRPIYDGGHLDPTKPVTPGAVTTAWDLFPEEFINRLRANFIQTGELTADVALVGELVSGDPAQGHIRVNGQGVFTYTSPTEPRTSLPNDPMQRDMFRGTADFDRMSASQGAVLGGDSTLQQGGTFRLSSSIDPPHLSPSVVTSWPNRIVAFPGGTFPAGRFGLAVNSTSEAYSVTNIHPRAARLLVFNPTTGAFTSQWSFPDGTYLYGLAYASIPNHVRTLEKDTAGTWKVRDYTYAAGPPVFVSEWTAAAPLPVPVARPAITSADLLGSDVTYIAQSQSDGTVIIWTYTAGVLTSTVTTPVLTDGTVNLVGVAALQGPVALAFDGGWLNSEGNSSLPIIDVRGDFGPAGGLVGSLQVANGDPSPAGIAHMDGDLVTARTWYLSAASNMLAEHSSWQESGAYVAEAAWCDSATGHKTLPGPQVQITKIPGSQITISMGDLPAGVDCVALYLGVGTVPLANSSMNLQGVSSVGMASVTVFGFVGGAAPLTVATLTGGSPSEWQGDDGSVIFDSSYSNPASLPTRMTAAEAAILGLGGSLGVDDDVFLGTDYIEVTGRV